MRLLGAALHSMPASHQPCGSVAALYRTGSGCVLHTFLSICVSESPVARPNSGGAHIQPQYTRGETQGERRLVSLRRYQSQVIGYHNINHCDRANLECSLACNVAKAVFTKTRQMLSKSFIEHVEQTG